MAAPVYITDLTNLELFETTSPAGVELTGYTQGGTVSEQEEDFFVQGIACYSAPNNRRSGLQSIAVPVSTFTMAAGECLFVWQVELAGNAMDTFDNGGLRVALCTNIDNYDIWYTGGKDFGRNPLGGWQNVVVYPTFTPDDTLGSLSTYDMVASCLNMVASIDKGNPHGLDATRYGRGEIMFWDGEATNYGTFEGGATENDLQTNKWGLLAKEGIGYLWKGLLSFGKDSSFCDFRDANRNITIDNTPRTYTSFNAIEVNHTSSYVEWTNINFTAFDPSQLSRGSFRVVDDCSVYFDTCIFTDMNTFEFSSRSRIYDTTFRRTANIDQSTAVFDGCLFENCTDPITLYVNDLDKIDNCEWESNGSNHAIYLDAESAGGTYSMSGNTFVNYATDNGATGNEVIKNESGGLVILNYTAGDKPSVYDVGDSSTSVLSSVTISLTVKKENGDPLVGALAYIDDPGNTAPFIMNTTTNESGIASVGWGGGPVVGAYWRVRKYGYKPFLAVSDIGAANKEIPVTLIVDPQQT